jgi:hypothetical protein
LRGRSTPAIRAMCGSFLFLFFSFSFFLFLSRSFFHSFFLSFAFGLASQFSAPSLQRPVLGCSPRPVAR